jgi:hypothetical protein
MCYENVLIVVLALLLSTYGASLSKDVLKSSTNYNVS